MMHQITKFNRDTIFHYTSFIIFYLQLESIKLSNFKSYFGIINLLEKTNWNKLKTKIKTWSN